MADKKLVFGVGVIIRLGVAIALIGWWMKILMIPWGNETFTIGAIITVLFYSWRTVLKQSKQLEDWVKLCFVSSLFIRAIISVNHLPKPDWVWFTLGTVLIMSLLIIFFRDSSSLIPKSKGNFVSSLLFSLAGFFTAIGILLKIMHWYYAGLSLTIGMWSAAALIIIDPFLKARQQPQAFSDENLLDIYLSSEKNTEKRKGFGSYKEVFILSAVFMTVGLLMSFLSLPGGVFVVMLGFIIGGVYLILNLRN